MRRPSLQRRDLKAAVQSRLTSDWQAGGGDINAEIRAHLALIRNRARHQGLNNNHVKRYLRMVQNHIVGPNGFGLQVQGRLSNNKMDRRNNQRLENLIWDWSRHGVCDLTGRQSFAAIQRLAVRTVARDGEALVRLWDTQPTSTNPFGLTLELLDPARLDHTLHLDLRNGNRVRMGVEINQAGRPLAYWLLTNLTGDSIYQTQQKRHERVPATDLLHLYYPEDAEQLRGLTWLSAPMIKLHQLDGYADAALVAARVGASKMGFFQSADPGIGAHALADEQDSDGEFMTSAEPGEFGVLPKGWTFNAYNPDYPSVAYEPFTKALLREAACGMNVSYHALTGDLSEVNFSSIRSGSLEEREGWMTLQAWFADSLLTPIYQRLLEQAALHNLLGQDASITLSRYRTHTWLPRRWSWVDPLKDIEANLKAISAGLKSPQQVAAEQGVDIEDVLDQLSAFQELLNARGLTLGANPAATPPTTQATQDDNDNKNG